MPQQIRDASDDRQAETKTLAPIARLVAHLVELLEDAVELLGRNADAGILDLDAQPVLNPAADDPDVSGLGIAHRILDQVPEHASEQRHIAANPIGAGFDLPAQSLGRGDRGVAGGDLVKHRGDREVGDLRLHNAGVQLGHVKEAIQQCLQRAEPILQLLQRLLASWALNVALEHAGEQDQGLKGLAQVVAGRRQELGLCQVGALGLLLGPAQFLLCRLALGDVAGDADDPDDGAGRNLSAASWW